MELEEPTVDKRMKKLKRADNDLQLLFKIFIHLRKLMGLRGDAKNLGQSRVKWI